MFFFVCNEICMTYLVHVWFDAANKKGVGGTECCHQGMKRVLKHISNKRIKINTAHNLCNETESFKPVFQFKYMT